jgi:hypothetical protein
VSGISTYHNKVVSAVQAERTVNSKITLVMSTNLRVILEWNYEGKINVRELLPSTGLAFSLLFALKVPEIFGY